MASQLEVIYSFSTNLSNFECINLGVTNRPLWQESVYWHLIDWNRYTLLKLLRDTDCPCDLYWTLYQWFYDRTFGMLRDDFPPVLFLCYHHFFTLIIRITIITKRRGTLFADYPRGINQTRKLRRNAISELENQMITYHSRSPLDQLCFPVCILDTPHDITRLPCNQSIDTESNVGNKSSLLMASSW